MGNIEHPWWLTPRQGEEPLIDDLPTSSRAAEVRTALSMVDREREERERLREQLRGAVEAAGAVRRAWDDFTVDRVEEADVDAALDALDAALRGQYDPAAAPRKEQDR